MANRFELLKESRKCFETNAEFYLLFLEKLDQLMAVIGPNHPDIEGVRECVAKISADTEVLYEETGKQAGQITRLKEEKKELTERLEHSIADAIQEDQRYTDKIVALKKENAALKEQISLQKG